MSNFSRGVETVKKNKIEMLEIKTTQNTNRNENIFDVITNRHNIVEENISAEGFSNISRRNNGKQIEFDSSSYFPGHNSIYGTLQVFAQL